MTPTEPSVLAYYDSGALMVLLALVPVLWIVVRGRAQILQVALDGLSEKFEILRSTDHVRLADFVSMTADLVGQGRKISFIEARQLDVIGRLDRIETQLSAHIRIDQAKNR